MVKFDFTNKEPDAFAVLFVVKFAVDGDAALLVIEVILYPVSARKVSEGVAPSG